jgi:chemotaxis-related protein WspB
MLFLLFQIGAGRYAIEARRVVEVLPLMRVDRVPGASAAMVCYRGEPLPVIDLSETILDRPSGQKLSTRILVITRADGSRLGLIAERANETLKRQPEDFVQSGVTVKDALWLGPVTRDERGFVQWIDPDQLPNVTQTVQTVEAA